jgi:predicted PurR-regulated permease PerM
MVRWGLIGLVPLVVIPLLLWRPWSFLGGWISRRGFAGLVALLLNPVVRTLERARIPRGLSVALVYLGFAAVVALAIVALGTVVVDQTRQAVDRVEAYLTVEDGRTALTGAEHDVDRLQRWLDHHGLEGIRIRRTDDFLSRLSAEDVTRYSREALDFLEGAAASAAAIVFALVLIVVVSIYMLLDLPRFRGAVDRRFPPAPGGPLLTAHVERALVGYVKGQVLLSLIIGASAGFGLWLLGAIGLVPGADAWALVFGTWVGLMELLPYLGPWLGAVPAVVYALVQEPVSALWVVGLFLLLHQGEGHVVVPNVMGRTLRLHPLLVIFGLIAGFEIYGIPGALVTLPVLAAGRACWEFFSGRVELEPWGEEGPAPVVEVVEREPPAAARR